MRHLVISLCTILTLTACHNATQDTEQVMVSIEPLRWAVQQVAGDSIDVATLVPKGVSPETYEPTPQEMIHLSHAKIFFHTGGLGFELACMDRMKQNAPHTHFVSLASVPSDTIAGPSIASHQHHHHHTDPHIWTSPRSMQRLIDTIAATLAVKTDSSATMHADSLMRDIPTGTAFAIYHPSLTHLAQDYGLVQVCIEAEGKEPSPATLAATIEQCRIARVRVVFVQQEFDDRSARQIAKQIGAKVVHINPLGYDWPQTLERIATALRPPKERLLGPPR